MQSKDNKKNKQDIGQVYEQPGELDCSPTAYLATSYKVNSLSREADKDLGQAKLTAHIPLVQKLLELAQDNIQYSISDYIKFHLSTKVDIQSFPPEIRRLYPFYKHCLKYLTKRGVQITIIDTHNIIKDAVLLGVESRSNILKEIKIFITDFNKTIATEKDQVIYLLGIVFSSFMFRDVKQKQVVFYTYSVKGGEEIEVNAFGTQSKDNTIIVSFLEEEKQNIVLHDSTYFICTLKCKTTETPNIKCIHPLYYSSLKYLYRELERMC